MKITTLSPSMVNSYLTCARKFFYNYVEKLSGLPNHYLAFGSAFHETLRENYYQKIRTEKDLPIDLLTDFFAEDLECRDVDWNGQTLSETKDEGVKTIRAYQQKVAPRVQPAHVEHQFSMYVVGRDWMITGKIDLIDSDLTVFETKTTKRKVNKPKPAHLFQTAVYTAAFRAQMNLPDLASRIDYSFRGSDEVKSFPVQFDDTIGKYVLTTFDQVARGIEAEMWVPNRGHHYCTKRFCDFSNQCEIDCGGRVAE